MGNFKGWTEKQIKDLKEQGKIRDYTVHKPKEPETPEGRLVAKHFKKKNEPKDFIGREVLAWCQSRCLVLYEEYNFNPLRRWRADWCIPDMMILIEYEGLGAKKTGHTTSDGYTANAEKYNSAQALGWKVLRFTYRNYQEVINELDKYATSMGK